MYPAALTILALVSMCAFGISAVVVLLRAGGRRLSTRDWFAALRRRSPWHLAVAISAGTALAALVAIKIFRHL